MIKKIVLIIIFMTVFTLPVCAEEYNVDKFYKEQYEISNFDSVYDLIDEDTKRIVDEFEFYPDSISDTGDFSIKNIVNVFMDIFKNGIKTPVGVFVSVLCTSILIGVTKSIEPTNKGYGISDLAGVSVVSVATIIPALMFFKTVISTIKSASIFISGFIPVFAGVLITSGKPTTSSLVSTSLLISSELCQQISSFIVLPSVSVYLAIIVVSSFHDRFNVEKISSSIQKTISFCMTTIMTIFSFVLSFQTIIGNSADSISLRAFKFIAGSTPIIGGVVSEATGVVSSCLNTLKNSCVIYAVICFAALFLPIIIQLLLWRLAMFCGGMVADAFGSDKISKLVNSVGYSFGIVTSVTVNIFIMFVISLTVIMVTTSGV